MKIKNIYQFIKKELYYNSVNNWILLSSLTIMITNFIIIYFSEFLSGDKTQTDVRSLLLSIIHLQMYLISLLSFILSYDSILAERENGIIDLIMSYSISLLDIFIGKILGNTLVFISSFLIGFTPIALYLNYLGIEFNLIFKFTIISIWLNIIFNSIAIYISNFSKDRTFVILLSIIIWIFFIFIFDILFILLTVNLYGIIQAKTLNIILLLNPIEIYRLTAICILMPIDAKDLFEIDLNIFKSNNITTIMITWLILIFLTLFKISKNNESK